MEPLLQLTYVLAVILTQFPTRIGRIVEMTFSLDLELSAALRT